MAQVPASGVTATPSSSSSSSSASALSATAGGFKPVEWKICGVTLRGCMKRINKILRVSDLQSWKHRGEKGGMPMVRVHHFFIPEYCTHDLIQNAYDTHICTVFFGCTQVSLCLESNSFHTLDVDQYVLVRSSAVYRRKLEFYGARDIPRDHVDSCMRLLIPANVVRDPRYPQEHFQNSQFCT